MQKKEPTVTLTLRIPASLHLHIAMEAQRDHRTINGWMNKLLEEYFQKNKDGTR